MRIQTTIIKEGAKERVILYLWEGQLKVGEKELSCEEGCNHWYYNGDYWFDKEKDWALLMGNRPLEKHIKAYKEPLKFDRRFFYDVGEVEYEDMYKQRHLVELL